MNRNQRNSLTVGKHVVKDSATNSENEDKTINDYIDQMKIENLQKNRPRGVEAAPQ